jgi:hypothetical protein
MIRNVVLSLTGLESTDSLHTLFTSSSPWSANGSDLVVFKNNALLIVGTDYTVLSTNQIKLSVAAQSTDTIQFLVTMIEDPSGTTITFDDRMIEADRVAKKLEGKTQTSIDKRISEESFPSTLIIHSNQIWTTTIDPNPKTAQSDGAVKAISYLALTQDVTVSGNRGWFVSNDGTTTNRILNFVPPDFGQPYTVRLFDNNKNEIPSSDSMNWYFDYQAGYLFIENINSYATPFLITGYIYDGEYGVNSLTTWREPIISYDLLPLYNNKDGDTRLVIDQNQVYVWHVLQNGWYTLDYGSEKFKDPVANVAALPISGLGGDIRLVLETNDLYAFNDVSNEWVLLTGYSFNPNDYYPKLTTDTMLAEKADLVHNHDTIYYRKETVDAMIRWRPAVPTYSSLPVYTSNKNGDVILTLDTNTIWRWYTDDPNNGQGYWAALIQSNFSWKGPVQHVTDLPPSLNSPGDVRLILSTNSVMFWDGTQWLPIQTKAASGSFDDEYVQIANLSWKMPVSTFNSLPNIDNSDGDVRVVLDTNQPYRWNEIEEQWIAIIPTSSWKNTVQDLASLSLLNHVDGDVVYVKVANNFYIYNQATLTWSPYIGTFDNTNYYTKTQIAAMFNVSSGHDHDGMNSKKIDYNDLLNIPSITWKYPVATQTSLPTFGNNLGDAIIVLDQNQIYAWNGTAWTSVSGGVQVANYDNLYYRKSYIDALINNTVSSLTNSIAQKAPLNHVHDDRYYQKTYIDSLFNPSSGHDHNGIDSKRVDFNNLANIPNFSTNHNHDQRYYTQSQLQTSGQSKVNWGNIVDAPNIGGSWGSPVQSISNLPVANNNTGDLRIVLDNFGVYRWDGTQWDLTGTFNIPVSTYWKDPVALITELPITGNISGDVRLVEATNTLYSWIESANAWTALASASSSGPSSQVISVDPNFQVYLNGVYLTQGDDYLTNVVGLSTQVTITTPVSDGDKVTIITYARFDFTVINGGNVFYVNQEIIKQVFDITGPTTTFSFNIPASDEVYVWLNGILLSSGLDYNIQNSSTIQLIDPAVDGDKVVIVAMNDQQGVNVYLREDQLSVTSQSTFLFKHTYTPGANDLLIFLNGDLQRVNDDYIEINADSIQFVDPCNVDDIITALFVEAGAGGGGSKYLSDLKLGAASDGSWTDGLIKFDTEYIAADALDNMNEALLDLAPAQATSLAGVNLTPQNIKLYSGYAADGNINYETFAGDYYNYLTQSNNFQLFSPDGAFANADNGVLAVYLNGIEVDNFDLAAAFVEANRKGNQSSSYGTKVGGAKADVGVAGTNGALRNSTTGILSIMSVGVFNSFAYWQKGVFRINITPGILRRGYNYIYVSRINSVVETTSTFKLFYDESTSVPTPVEILFSQSSLLSSKYLSGIRYYSIGDSFNLEYTLINSYSDTYVEDPISFGMPGLQLENINWNDVRNSGMSNPPNLADTTLFNSIISLNEYNDYSTNALLTFNTINPFGPGTKVSTPPSNIYVNTYTNKSTDLIEYFVDENYRLPVGAYDIPLTVRQGIWDSKLALVSGNALIINQTLAYPQGTYSTVLPSQSLNYSNFSGNQFYLRSFYKKIPSSNAQINIQGITKNDLLSSKITIDIKLPSQTGWLSLNNFYDVASFSGTDTDGCLIGIDSTGIITATFGTFSTVYSGYTIIMRIGLTNNSPNPNFIQVLW